MKLLFDVVHPAHVHFYRHLIEHLKTDGHEIIVVAREKDVTCDLLDLYGIPYESVGRAGSKGLLEQAFELFTRDAALFRIAREHQADVILSRNPAGPQVARLVGGKGVFDTDDGRAAGIHFRAAAPFAHIITTPDCLPEDYGSKHVRYPSYKVLAYLHPNHFSPDPAVKDLLGVEPDEPYFLVRFVAMTASHDRKESGLSYAVKREIIERLRAKGRVFITSEAQLPTEWRDMEFSVPPHMMHDAVAFASLCIGDSHTMAAEAAVLGVPSLRASTFSGRLAPQIEMEERYGLTFAYHPLRSNRMLERLDEILDHELDPDIWQERRELLLRDKCDLTEWYFNLLMERVIDTSSRSRALR